MSKDKDRRKTGYEALAGLATGSGVVTAILVHRYAKGEVDGTGISTELGGEGLALSVPVRPELSLRKSFMLVLASVFLMSIVRRNTYKKYFLFLLPLGFLFGFGLGNGLIGLIKFVTDRKT